VAICQYWKDSEKRTVSIRPQSQLNIAEKKCLKNISLGTELPAPFENDFFDVVTMLDVLEHMEEGPALHEAYRLLKPGGILVINVPAYNWLWSNWDEELHHLRRYNKKSLRRALLGTQFTVNTISYFYSYLLVPLVLVRSLKGLFLKNPKTSEFKLSSPVINKIGTLLTTLELKLLESWPIPFGTR